MYITEIIIDNNVVNDSTDEIYCFLFLEKSFMAIENPPEVRDNVVNIVIMPFQELYNETIPISSGVIILVKIGNVTIDNPLENRMHTVYAIAAFTDKGILFVLFLI